MSPIRVLLVAMDGGAARSILSDTGDFQLECVSSFAEAALSLRARATQVIVVALQNPRQRDASLLRDLQESAAGVPLLVASPPVDEEIVVGLIKAGAGGYLFERDVTRLPAAVRELLSGGIPMSAPVSQVVLQRARRSSAKMAAVQPTDPPGVLLTERQQQILGFLQHGHSYEDIASALGLSVNTVRSHVRTVYDRLGVSTKVEAVMVAMELGILQKTRLTTRPPPKF